MTIFEISESLEPKAPVMGGGEDGRNGRKGENAMLGLVVETKVFVKNATGPRVLRPLVGVLTPWAALKDAHKSILGAF